MSYKVIPEIPRSRKTLWSPGRGGRLYQYIGSNKVPKFSFSPYTAKANKIYTFYADVELSKEIESPPNSGKMRKFLTMTAYVGTFVDFRKDTLSGEVMERISSLAESMGAEITSVEYWRNKGSR